jgi:hypothetical protein
MPLRVRGLDRPSAIGHVRSVVNTQPSHATRSGCPWAALTLVCALGLRALVPAGFMLEPVRGHAQIVLCGSHGSPAIHSHGAGTDRNEHRGGVDPTCPFAQSAAPAIFAALPVTLPPPVAAAAPPGAADVITVGRSGPVRQQFPRGPPHFT